MSDALFFIGVLFFFFLVWFFGGGPTRPISFAGPYITPITDVGQTQRGYGTTTNWFTGVGTGAGSTYRSSASSVRGGILSAEQELRRLQSIADDLTAFGEPSPYKGMVRISSVSRGQDVEREYLTLTVSSTNAAPLSITGWSLSSSATGKSARIPGGTELPTVGVNQEAPLVLDPGSRVYVATGESPIGTSFRENMCTGYFAERQVFYPALSRSCPTARTEFDRYYPGNKLSDDRCYAYVSSIPLCTAVGNPPPSLSDSCDEFVDQYLDYTGCVWAHRYESKFKSTVYRVYLEHRGTLWKTSREAIKLLDQNGKTVDLYTY